MISACRAECPGSNPGRGVWRRILIRFVDRTIFVSTTGSRRRERGAPAASVVSHRGHARRRKPGAYHRGPAVPALQRASAQRGPRPRPTGPVRGRRPPPRGPGGAPSPAPPPPPRRAENRLRGGREERGGGGGGGGRPRGPGS